MNNRLDHPCKDLPHPTKKEVPTTCTFTTFVFILSLLQTGQYLKGRVVNSNKKFVDLIVSCTMHLELEQNNMLVMGLFIHDAFGTLTE